MGRAPAPSHAGRLTLLRLFLDFFVLRFLARHLYFRCAVASMYGYESPCLGLIGTTCAVFAASDVPVLFPAVSLDLTASIEPG